MEIPKICRYCGGVVRLVPAAEVYGMAAAKRLGIEQERFYQCQNCNARVGCHKGTTRPLGNLANETLRMKRKETHQIFDSFWRERGMTRTQGYHWMAKKLRLSVQLAHIGGFEMDRCQRLIDLCEKERNKEAAYGFELEPTVVEGIRTKMMAADPVAANHVRLMFEMYAEPETSFGDITRYFEEQGIKIYGKSLTRPFLSQLLRNPVYAQADLEMYEFFKSQGAVVVNDAADFAGTNGCYLYQGRDVKEDKDKSLKDQILVIAPHEGFVPSDIWLRCRKKLMTNITFQNGRKARNTWLAGKIKCGKCGYALKTTHNPSGYEYLRCSKRADHKGCPGCGTLRKNEFEQFIFTAMGEKFREFKLLRGGEEKANPKITAYQVELAQVEAEIEKLLDTLTGANATLLAYANKKIEDLDNRRKTLSKAIADLSVETLSSQQIELLSGYLDDWENISFEDKRKAADGLISSISATSDYVKIEWKI